MTLVLSFHRQMNVDCTACRPQRYLRRWQVAILFVCAGAPAAARPDSYVIPDDYEIVCLERATGKLMWRTKPESLPPRLTVTGRVLVAEKEAPPDNEHTTQKEKWLLDVRTGGILKGHSDGPRHAATTIGPLAPLPRNFNGASGARYERSKENGRQLVSLIEDKRTVVLSLEDFPKDLHIFGDLAVFTFNRLAGGEVYAYHLIDDRLVWEFDASKTIDVPEAGYTGIAVDGERILVSTAQTLFALDARSGGVLWMSALPKQSVIRVWPVPRQWPPRRQ